MAKIEFLVLENAEFLKEKIEKHDPLEFVYDMKNHLKPGIVAFRMKELPMKYCSVSFNTTRSTAH